MVKKKIPKCQEMLATKCSVQAWSAWGQDLGWREASGLQGRELASHTSCTQTHLLQVQLLPPPIWYAEEGLDPYLFI